MLDEINLRQKEDMEKSQRSMAEVLHRVQEETTLPLDVYGDNGEEEAMEELQKRIENGEDIQLEDLPKSLQEQFLRDMENGGGKNIVATWNPWWLMPESVHDEQTQRKVVDVSYPAIPCIRRFLKNHEFEDVRLPVKCNPSLPYSCMEIVFFYCLFMRLYNGDTQEAETAIAADILGMSEVLSKSAVFASMEEVVSSLLCRESLLSLIREDVMAENPFSLEPMETNADPVTYVKQVLNDLLALLEIPHFLIDAMAHCAVMFRHEYRKEKRKEWMLAERKCVFLTSTLRKCSTEEFWLLQKEVGVRKWSYG